ncbi:hypothetical protein Actkin_05998 [Actinokineospora sp. UTMC 2448]|nr:hypothetical protein Actkin_05998 [Actinokineospora sp. UTMC 2448]
MATALIGYGRLSIGLVEKFARDIENLVAACFCPRCGRGPQGEWASASMATSDGCIAICDACATQETIVELSTGVVPPLATWPTLNRRR